MTLADQFPALVVILPLLAAPLCIVFDNPRTSWWITLAATFASFYIAVQLFLGFDQPISYALGGWDAPWGIEFRVDQLTSLVLLLVTAIGAISVVYAPRIVQREIELSKQTGLYAAMLLTEAGLLGMTVTGDAFNVFVFLEISSLGTYALIAMGRDKRALTASFEYLVMGTIGGTFILIGLGFVYMMTGTLNMEDLAQRLPAVADKSTAHAGFAFITVGILLKLAMFPMHLWLPNAYAYAPSVVSIFLAATSTKVAIYLLMRFVFTIFGHEVDFQQFAFTYIVLPLSVMAVLMASLVAVYETNIKRMLAYSSVAQIGYILMGFALLTQSGLQAAMLHLFNHAIMKAALFMALGALAWHLGSVTLHNLSGIGRRMPLTSMAFVLGGISLIGLPATAGFISKWYLILAAIEKDWWWLVPIIIIGSLLAAVYIWRVVEVIYFKPGDSQVRAEAPLGLLIPTWLLVFANIYFGLDTSYTVDVTAMASKALFGGGL